MDLAVPEPTWRQDLASSTRRLSAVVATGFAAGALVGGVGGRIAMFILRVTSDPSLHGAETDDGFVIGQFSGATGFLVMVTGFLGLLGALGYLVVRSWLPRRRRAALFGVLGALVGGAAFIRPGGIDFTRIDPLLLAIVMFIALPAVYGVATGSLVERLLGEDAEPIRSNLWFLGLIPFAMLVLFGIGGLGVMAATAAVWGIRRSEPGVRDLWRSTPVVLIGRIGLVAVAGVALVSLVRDVVQIL